MDSTHAEPLGWAIGRQSRTRITGLFCLEELTIYQFLMCDTYFLRKGHYIVAEYVDKVTNKYRPNYPRQVWIVFFFAIPV
jgi:hypothetical protein